MPAARHTVSIAEPASKVFAFLANGGNATSWRPGVLDIKHESGEGVGAIYRQGVKGPGGRRIAADYEITVFEPNTKLAFRAIAGPVRPVGEYLLEEAGGSTTLTFSLEAEVSGIKKLFMAGMVQRTMDAEVGAIETAKRILEGQTG